MKKRMLRLFAVLSVFVLAAVLFTVSSFAASDDGYDIVLALDESSSMSKNETKLRNDAAKLFAQILTDDCRLGVLYFTKGINDTCDVLPLKSYNNRSTLLSALSRTERDDTGTNICCALDEAVNMLGDSSREKAVILFTDGRNFVNLKESGPLENTAETKKLNEATKARILQTKTEDHDNPIPLYVVFLDEDNNKDNKNGMINLFTVDGKKPDFIDARKGDAKLSESVFGDPSQIKVIYVDDASDLVDVLPKLFYKIKSMGFKDFEKKPDKSNNGYATVAFDIPDFGIKRVQFTVSSKAKYTVGRVFPVDNPDAGVDFSNLGEQPAKTVGVFTVSGDALAIADNELNIRSASLTPGKWQIEFYGEKTVKGTVSLVADFNGDIDFIQDGKKSSHLECGTDIAAATVLKKGGSFKKIPAPDNSEAELIIDSLGIKQTVQGDGEKYAFEPITFKTAGTYPYTVRIKYADLSYDINREVTVVDNAPKKMSHLPLKVVFYGKDDVSADGLDGYIDIGAVDSYIYDVNDKENLCPAFTSDIGDCLVMPVEELIEVPADGTDDGTDEPAEFESVTKNHLFISANSKAQHLTVDAVDSAGTPANFTYTVKTIEKGRFILKILLIVLLTAAAAAGAFFAVRAIIFGKEGDKKGKMPQAYNAFIYVPRNSDGNPYMCFMDKMQNHTALYRLNDLVGFTVINSTKQVGTGIPLKLVLCGGEPDIAPYLCGNKGEKFRITEVDGIASQSECTRFVFDSKNKLNKAYSVECSGIKFILWVGGDEYYKALAEFEFDY